MKEEQNITAEEVAMLQRIKQAMGDEGLLQASSLPQRKEMEDEYLRLTRATLGLIRMLERVGINQRMTDTEKFEYSDLMVQITDAATKGFEQVEQNKALNRDTLLAAMPAVSASVQ